MSISARHGPARRAAPLLTLGIVAAAAGAACAQPPPIRLPDQPPAQNTVDLRERWRLGGDDDQGVLLGLVQTGVADGRGNVYLLDRQMAQVLVVSPQGEVTATLGRAGEGPGELTRPQGLVLMEGGKVGVVQGFPGKITILNPDGTPGGDVAFNGDAGQGGFSFLREMELVQGNFLGVKGRNSFDMQTQKSQTTSMLCLLDPTGKELKEFARHQEQNDLAKPFFDEAASFSELQTWDVGPEGLLYTVPERESYTIAVRDLQGNAVRTLTRAFSPRERDAEDKERVTSGYVMVVNGRRIIPENRVLDRDPAILDLNVAADGRLFVTNCRQSPRLLPAGCAGRYDVISPAGELLEELTVRVPDFDPEQDQLAFLDGRLFLHLRNVISAREAMLANFGGDGQQQEDAGEAEPLEVVLYALP